MTGLALVLSSLLPALHVLAADEPLLRLPMPAAPAVAGCPTHRERLDPVLNRLVRARWRKVRESGAAKEDADRQGKEYYAQASREWCLLDAKAAAYEAWLKEMGGLETLDPGYAERWICEWPDAEYARIKTAWRAAEGLKTLLDKEVPLGAELLREREAPPPSADGTVDLSVEAALEAEAERSKGRLADLGARALAQRGRWERLRATCKANSGKFALARAEKNAGLGPASPAPAAGDRKALSEGIVIAEVEPAAKDAFGAVVRQMLRRLQATEEGRRVLEDLQQSRREVRAGLLHGAASWRASAAALEKAGGPRAEAARQRARAAAFEKVFRGGGLPPVRISAAGFAPGILGVAQLNPAVDEDRGEVWLDMKLSSSVLELQPGAEENPAKRGASVLLHELRHLADVGLGGALLAPAPDGPVLQMQIIEDRGFLAQARYLKEEHQAQERARFGLLITRGKVFGSDLHRHLWMSESLEAEYSPVLYRYGVQHRASYLWNATIEDMDPARSEKDVLRERIVYVADRAVDTRLRAGCPGGGDLKLMFSSFDVRGMGLEAAFGASSKELEEWLAAHPLAAGDDRCGGQIGRRDDESRKSGMRDRLAAAMAARVESGEGGGKDWMESLRRTRNWYRDPAQAGRRARFEAAEAQYWREIAEFTYRPQP